MKFKIYGKKYDVNTKLTTSAKNMIQEILEHVEAMSDTKGIDDYYTAFVIMMYVTSSAILKNINVDKLTDLLIDFDEDDDGKPLRKDRKEDSG